MEKAGNTVELKEFLKVETRLKVFRTQSYHLASPLLLCGCDRLKKQLGTDERDYRLDTSLYRTLSASCAKKEQGYTEFFVHKISLKPLEKDGKKIAPR